MTLRPMARLAAVPEAADDAARGGFSSLPWRQCRQCDNVHTVIHTVDTVTLPCHCDHCRVTAFPLLCHCRITAFPLPCHCRVTAVSLPCHCLSTAVSPPFHCLDVPLSTAVSTDLRSAMHTVTRPSQPWRTDGCRPSWTRAAAAGW